MGAHVADGNEAAALTSQFTASNLDESGVLPSGRADLPSSSQLGIKAAGPSWQYPVLGASCGLVAIAGWYLFSSWGARKQQSRGEAVPVEYDSGDEDEDFDAEVDGPHESEDEDDFGLGDTFMGFRKGLPTR